MASASVLQACCASSCTMGRRCTIMLLLRSCHLSSSWPSMAPGTAPTTSMTDSLLMTYTHHGMGPHCSKLRPASAWHAKLRYAGDLLAGKTSKWSQPGVVSRSAAVLDECRAPGMDRGRGSQPKHCSAVLAVICVHKDDLEAELPAEPGRRASRAAATCCNRLSKSPGAARHCRMLPSSL